MKKQRQMSSTKQRKDRVDKDPTLLKEKQEKIAQFLHDVKVGETRAFDVTTPQGFWKEFLVRIKSVDITGLGSQLAFFFLLSLFPLLIFLITLLPFLNLDQSQVFIFLREYTPQLVYQMLYTTLNEVLENRNSGLLSIGAIATVWSASKGMNALTRALNRSYFTEEKRSFIVARGMSIVFTMALIGVFVIALLLPIFGQQIGKLLFSIVGYKEGFIVLWNKVRWTVPPMIIFVVFSAIYWIVPNLKIRFSSVLPGALLATLGWIVTSYAFSFYVSNFGDYSKTYGSIGAIIVLMLWLYFSSMILMFGGVLNALMFERSQILQAKSKSHVVSSK